jgi:hypothetical protein
MDDLAQSPSDHSIHSLESSISCIAGTPPPTKSVYDSHQSAVQQCDGPDPTQDCHSPYGMYDTLQESFSSGAGTANTTNTKEMYERFAANVRQTVSNASSSTDSYGEAELSYETSHYSFQDEDDAEEYGICFCSPLQMFVSDNESRQDDAHSETRKKDKRHRDQRSKKRRNKSGTESSDDKELKKAKLKKKLASMDPKARNKFKKKLVQRKRESDRRKHGGTNISKDLRDKQNEHVRKQQKKKERKQREKNR